MLDDAARVKYESIQRQIRLRYELVAIASQLIDSLQNMVCGKGMDGPFF